jgi:hypothetical protein
VVVATSSSAQVDGCLGRGGALGGALLLDRISKVQEADEALPFRQPNRGPSGLLAQNARGAPVARKPVRVCSEQHDVAGDRGGVQVLLVLLGIAGQGTGGDDQGRSAVELRRRFRPSRLL